MPLAEISDLLQASRAPSAPRDYLQAYLEYARAVSAGDHATVEALIARLAPADTRVAAAHHRGDGFVRAVEAFLRDLGHTPERGGDGDAFGLDFVIREPASGRYALGIECDAPQHRLLAAARAREIWRPRILARSVRALHRVSSRGWAHAGEEERRRLADAVARALKPRDPAP